MCEALYIVPRRPCRRGYKFRAPPFRRQDSCDSPAEKDPATNLMGSPLRNQTKARASPTSDARRRSPGNAKNQTGCPRIRRPGLSKQGQIIISSPPVHHLRLGTINVGSMTGKGSELTKEMKTRKIDIAAVQEVKWSGGKAKDLSDGYKILYNGSGTKRNGVGVIVAPNLRDCVAQVHRYSDRLMAVTLDIEASRITVFSAYAPQSGCSDAEKGEFYSLLSREYDAQPGRKVLMGDFNGHVGKQADMKCHGGHGYGDRNDEGERLLDFAEQRGLVLINTYFPKRDSHLITYNSGDRNSQIDFILAQKRDFKKFLDAKVIPSTNVAPQHRMLIADTRLPIPKPPKADRTQTARIKWWKLPELQKGLNISLPAITTVEETWSKLRSNVHKTATEQLGKTVPGRRYIDKATWLWTESVKEAVRAKKAAFKKWKATNSQEDREKYWETKRAAKVEVAKRRAEYTERLYTEIEKPGGDRLIFRIAKRRQKATEDIEKYVCIDNEHGNLITDREEVKRQWHRHFETISNVEFPHPPIQVHPPLPSHPLPIEKAEVEEAIGKMKNGKATGPDDIPSEVWKSNPEGVKWLTDFLNLVVNTNTFPSEWYTSSTIPIFKKKGSPSNCSNYRPIRLLCHTMKILERIVDKRIRACVQISSQQCGFVKGKATTDAIFAVRQLVEKFTEKKQPLHLAFLDLEKAFDRTPRGAIIMALRDHKVPEYLIEVVKLMYRSPTSRVLSAAGMTLPFPVTVGVHQGSALSPLLFILVMDSVTRDIQKPAPWCLLYADDVMLANDSREELQKEVQTWKDRLAKYGLKLNVGKTEYLEIGEQRSGTIKVDGQQVPKIDLFKYLGSRLASDGHIRREAESRIAATWLKWRSTTGVMCDKKISEKLKGRLYKAAIRPVALYGCETWPTPAEVERRLATMETRMLRWSLGHTLLDHVKNETILKRTNVAPIKDKMRQSRLRWYGHVLRADREAICRSPETVQVPGSRPRGRPKLRYSDTLSRDMEAVGLRPSLAQNREVWRRKSQRADPLSG